MSYLDDEELEATRRVNGTAKKEITLDKMEKYIKSKYSYKTEILDNKLTVKYGGHVLTLEIKGERIHISNDYKKSHLIGGHAYGKDTKDFTLEIIDEELNFFRLEKGL